MIFWSTSATALAQASDFSKLPVTASAKTGLLSNYASRCSKANKHMLVVLSGSPVCLPQTTTRHK